MSPVLAVRVGGGATGTASASAKVRGYSGPRRSAALVGKTPAGHMRNELQSLQRAVMVCASASNDNESGDSAFRKALSKANIAEGGAPKDEDVEVLTGEELAELIRDKWGARYDCRITRRRNGVGKLRFYLQVMWKFLEQKSFPLSEEEYYEQLDAVASLVSEWGLADYVRTEIQTSKMNPVIGNTIGGGARCVSIPLVDSDEVR